MKKIVLTLLVLFSVTNIFAQTLHFNSENANYNQCMLISEIKSIYYDFDKQIQTVNTQSGVVNFPLDEVSEIVFQDKMNYAHIEDAVNGMDAIISEDGKALIYGEDETFGNIMQYGAFDFQSGNWNEESMLVFQMNEDGMPISIMAQNLILTIEYNNDGTINVSRQKEDGGFEVIAANISINNSQTKSRGIRRAPDFGDVTNVAGWGTNIWGIINDLRGSGKVSLPNGVGGLGNIIGLFNTDAGFLVSGTGDLLAYLQNGISGLYGGALTLANYLWQKSREFQLQHLGDWRIEVISAQQKTRNQCEIVYSITGINDVPEGNPRHRMLIKNAQTGRYRSPEFDRYAQNGTFRELVNINEAGEYTVEMSLYDDCHKAIRQLSYPAYKFYMVNLGIDKVEVKDDYKYNEGSVHYNLSVYLEGDKESLEQATTEYGYFIQFSNSIDYNKAKLSTIFATTECTKDLVVDRESFFEKNYTTYHAEATEYKIGAYAVLKNGNILMFDEQDLNGLVYDKKPKLTFTGASVIGTDAEDYEDYFYYSTEHTISYEAEGTFWFDNLNLGMPSDVSDNVGLVQIQNGDGKYTDTYWYNYPSTSTVQMFLYLVGNLTSGGSFVSDNMLLYNGMPVTSISIVGNSRSAMPSSSAKKAPVSEQTKYRSFFSKVKITK